MQLSRTCPKCQYVGSIDESFCPECATLFDTREKPNTDSGLNLPQTVIRKIRDQFEILKTAQPEIRLEWPVFLATLVRILEHHLPSPSREGKEARFSDETSISSWLDQLHWGELFLTTACANGDEQAWTTFHACYHNCILKAARNCTNNAAAAEELSGSLMTGLYFQPDVTSPRNSRKIGQYHGLGSLEGWLKVVVTRMSIDQSRSDQRKVSLDELEMDLPDQSSLADASSAVEDREVREAAAMVNDSLTVALGGLDSKERLILSLYYLENLNLKDLAKLMNVHESTMSRMLEKIRQRLRKSVERRLRERFRIKTRELPFYLEIACTHCEIDMSKLLKK